MRRLIMMIMMSVSYSLYVTQIANRPSFLCIIIYHTHIHTRAPAYSLHIPHRNARTCTYTQRHPVDPKHTHTHTPSSWHCSDDSVMVPSVSSFIPSRSRKNVMEVMGSKSGSEISPVSLLSTPSPTSQLHGTCGVSHMSNSETDWKQAEGSEDKRKG